MGVFFPSYNSRSSDDFAGSSCKLKLYGDLILLLCSSACLFLVNVIARMLNYISHHISPCISNSSLLYVKCVYELQDIGGNLHDSTLQVCIASKANSSISVFTLHMFIPVENLTYIVINHQKGRDCKCI